MERFTYDQLIQEAQQHELRTPLQRAISSIFPAAVTSPFNSNNTTLIVDVSKWVRRIDVSVLKAAGVRGIIARIGEGINTNEDDRWAYYVDQAAAAGIPCHGYFVNHPELYDNYDQNVNVQLSRIQQFCKNKTIHGLWIDCEVFKDSEGKITAPTWISERTRGLIDETQRAFPNIPVGLYTGGWFVDSYAPQMKVWIHKYPLWWAWYTVTQSATIEWEDLSSYYPMRTPTNLPPDATGQTGAKLSLWQWSGDRLKLPGMYNRDTGSDLAAADLNFFMGNEQAWYEFSNFTPTAPPVDPPPDNDDDDPTNPPPVTGDLATVMAELASIKAEVNRIGAHFK